MGLGLHCKYCKLCFDTCEMLFRYQGVGLYSVVDEVLVVKGFFKILIHMADVGVQNLCIFIHLAGNTLK